MGIDPFTFAAQLFNFFVLIAILRHFLYQPVLRTMDARERFIAEQMEQAKLAQQSAAEWEQKRLQQIQEVDEVRAHRLAEVRAEIERAQQEGLAKVRQEVADLGQRWRDSKAREIDSWGAAENQRLAEVVLQIVRAALSDLATVTLEHQMVEVLLAQSDPLPGGASQIFSAFPLDPDLQGRLLSRFPSADFQVNPALITGIVIRVNDHKVGWSLDSYLAGLSQKLRQC